MRMYFAGVGAALSTLVIAASPPAVASTIIGPQDTSVDWAQEFCLTDCTLTQSPTTITQIDVIMATPGVTFTGIGPVYSDIGETSRVSNVTTTLGATESTINFGSGDKADVFLTLNFSPDYTSTPFTFYWEQFAAGGQFIATDNSATSSDMVAWNGSTWTITPMTAPVSVTPLPPAAPLFAAGLGLLAFMGYWGKRRMRLDREGAPQFA